MDYKNKVAQILKDHINMEVENIEKLIEIPPKSEMEIMLFHVFN